MNLRPGTPVEVIPRRVNASPWPGVIVAIDVRGCAGNDGRRGDELGVTVLPTMRGPGWSREPVWVRYECVRVAAAA
jgi:hypothetical protein